MENMAPLDASEIRAVIEAVALSNELPVRVLRGDSRVREVSRARRELYHALFALGMSPTAIGRWLNKDRTSVAYGLRKYKECQDG